MVERDNRVGLPLSPDIINEPEHSTSVRLSDVLYAKGRLEASAHSVETRVAIDELQEAELKLIPLTDSRLCSGAQNAFRFKRVFVEPEHGIPFLTSSDIISMRRKPRTYLSSKVTKKLNELRINKWDVLISCSGTIGNVALASPAIDGVALSQDAIRVTATSPEIAGYLAAFLRSRYGRLQMTQSTYGSVVTHIEPEHLESILVPELPFPVQTEIGKLMLMAAEQRDEANRLIDEAQSLFAGYLDLPPIEHLLPTSVNPRIRRLRLSQWDGRLEASYHSALADAVNEQLRRSSATITTVGDSEITNEVRAITKFRKRVYVRRGGIPLLSSKQILQVDPIEVKGLAKGAHTKDLGEIGLDHNMILVTSSGTIAKTQIIPRYMAEWTANQHSLRIIGTSNVISGYLYAWLESDYGRESVRRYSYGSVILTVDKQMLESAPVPLLRADKVEEIGNKVLEANELRDRAWRNERHAIDQFSQLVGNPTKVGHLVPTQTP